MGIIGANCSWVARVTTPRPLPQPHGWVRLGFEVSRFPHYWVGGLACAEFPRGAEFWGSLAPFFLDILKQKEIDIGPLFPEFRGWPLWFMASIALWGPQNLAPEVVPGASLHSEALSPECGRECQETGDCGPARHVGDGRWGLLGPTAHGLLG